ncbi:GMC oxidoreductase [Ceratobasidium sp. AG-Ba]|nr:GMC oxidoreductase [Ceratobasidium sp. AG-Ba]
MTGGYRLATPTNWRAWTTQQMAAKLDAATNMDDYWDVLAANHEVKEVDGQEVLNLPEPPVYDPTKPYTDKKRLPLHRVHSDDDGFGIDGVDVFIAGSGPVGATYARKLVDAGLSVVMCELGATDTKPAASHKKNEIEYQKDIDRFVNVIKGALSPVSVALHNTFVDTLDPASWNNETPFVTNGKNPEQDPATNLSAQAVTRGTGGMATHWTCAVPHFLKGVERPVIHPQQEDKDDQEWNELYKGAGELIYRSETEFDECSIRHTLILNTLKETPIVNKDIKEPNPKDGQGPSSIGVQDVNLANEPPQNGRVYRPLPLAARRLTNSPRYVEWMSAESIYEDLIVQQHVFRRERERIGLEFDKNPPTYQKKFRLLTNHRVTRYALSQKGCATAVEVQDMMSDRDHQDDANMPINFYIKAKYFITCAGAVANPQILYNSGLNNFATHDKKGNDASPPNKIQKAPMLPALGKYITEQPMAFCQVVLKKSLVDMVSKNPWNLDWWAAAYKEHEEENQYTKNKDPLPFPRYDPEPQITSPVTKERPWHTQIHRDAFSYGAIAATIDSRLVCDFRWFGRTQPEESNKILFERDLTDAYGMPQPTFFYKQNAESVREAHLMMTDMCNVAQRVGGYLPGSEPQFMAPGLALHLGGTTRLGHDDNKQSCANFRGQVHGFQNLYVAGNGVIDTPFAANPTLTSMALAIYSAEDIANKEGERDVCGFEKNEQGKYVRKEGKVKELFKRVVPRTRAPWPPA